MSLALRLGRGEAPGWIYSPATPGFFFTGGYCCKLESKRFFLIGGNQIGGLPMRSVISFISTAWVSHTEMPGTGRFDSGAGVINQTILCVAGFDIEPLSSCVRYKSSSDEWNTMPELIGPRRFAHSATGTDQKGFVFCGRDTLYNNLTTSAVFETEVWMSAPDVPPPARARAAATSMNGRVFLTGGTAGLGELLRVHLEFVVGAYSWIQKSSIPLPGRQGHATFSAMREQILTGGGTPLQTSTLIYSPPSDAWRSSIPLPLPARQWAGFGPGTRSDNGFVSGGETDSGIRLLNHNEFIGGTWLNQTPIPVPARKQLMGGTT